LHFQKQTVENSGVQCGIIAAREHFVLSSKGDWLVAHGLTREDKVNKGFSTIATMVRINQVLMLDVYELFRNTKRD
jgi:hypothetical protein